MGKKNKFGKKGFDDDENEDWEEGPRKSNGKSWKKKFKDLPPEDNDDYGNITDSFEKND